MRARLFCWVALFCAACSAAPDDGGEFADHDGELELGPPEEAVDPGAPPVPRVERSAPATVNKPTPDPWRVTSGVGKPTPDPWSSWTACEALAQMPASGDCDQGEQGVAPATEAPRR